jgi:uncharacterized membrane protein required for colicin V production
VKPLSTGAVRRARQAASVVCAAAVGSLLFSVHIATMVFREMPDDRLLAGRIAGRALVGAYATAAVASVVAIVVTVVTRAGILNRVAAFALLAIASLELFVIAPAILAHGTGWPGSFASLHATGGGLHLLLTVLSLVLAWRLLGE